MKTFKFSSFYLPLFLTFSLAASVTQARELRVDSQARQKMMYGMDFERLWSWGGLKPDAKAKLAKYAVKDCHVTYVRVGIDGGAEFEEGKFTWDSYDTQLDCMRTLKKANPKIKFFASPRPFHEAIAARHPKGSYQRENAPFTCFPLWIGVFDNPYNQGGKKRKFVELHWDKAADYMVRNIKFLRRKGFDIAYMDIKNENDRYYRPQELSNMVKRIESQLPGKMPLVVGPSSYDVNGAIQWLEEAKGVPDMRFPDIFSSHNTKNRGNPEDLGEIAKSMDRPLWNTEFHGFQGPDDMVIHNTKILFDFIRAGFGAINDWLSLGNEKKEHKMFRNVRGDIEVMKVYYIFKELVNFSTGGHYLETNIPEGITSSVAFEKDGMLSLWVLNESNEPIPDLKVSLGDWKAKTAIVDLIQWDNEGEREGSVGRQPLRDASSFTTQIPAYSLTFFAIPVTK